MDVFFDVNIFPESDDSSDEEIEDYINIIHRRPRIFHDRPNHMNYWDDYDFFNRFRLTKESVQLILGQIEERIRYPTER